MTDNSRNSNSKIDNNNTMNSNSACDSNNANHSNSTDNDNGYNGGSTIEDYYKNKESGFTRDEIKNIRERFLRCTYSADIYDVMDKMGYPNQCLDHRIAPFKDSWKVCGPAVTLLGTREPITEEELHPEPDYDKFWVFDYFYDGCVIVINAEKEDKCGSWGEMMSYGSRNAGASGVVIDGGTRDKAGILEIDNWSCFARYSSPVESDKRWRPKDINRPIFMSGTLTDRVLVRPGDWIFGDCDAVMVIPKEIVMGVLKAVEDVSEREVLSRKAFNEGKSIHEVYRLYNRA